ncbi:MAG: hypothetical protein JWL90_2090 [Chthoniobacteraceae bacterium]|nr:hypothetical protein [Chthoniobacteraceae bacterium]
MYDNKAHCAAERNFSKCTCAIPLACKLRVFLLDAVGKIAIYRQIEGMAANFPPNSGLTY